MDLPSNSNFEEGHGEDGPAASMAEHLAEVAAIFQQYDPAGRRGLNYAEFRTVLTDVLGIDFEGAEAEQLDAIVTDLDPEGTGYVQFAALQKQWTQQAQQEDMEAHFGMLDNIQSNFDESGDEGAGLAFDAEEGSH